MRDVPPDLLTHLQQQHGAEPVLILEIQWVENGPKILYADQKLSGENYPHPKILQVGNFDTSLQVTGSGDSQQINVTLDDSDGTFQGYLNQYDIHKRPCWVYQGFQGLTTAHKILLFKGEISSPVILNEGDRTLSFDILTKQEEAEVAFSMEEGNFPSLPEEALGKTWPLVFGEVCNMQAVQVRAPLRGVLTHGEGVHDFTLPDRICQARYIQCASMSIGTVVTVAPDEDGDYVPSQDRAFGPDLECVEARFETICNLEYLLEQQQSYENLYLNIYGGEDFPQGETVNLNINGAIFTGYFSGTQFRVLERQHPDYGTLEYEACHEIPERSIGLVSTHWNSDWVETETGTAWYFDGTDDCDEEPVYRQAYEGGPSASQKAFDDMPEAGFFWIPPGADVYLEEDAEILYIVNLLPSTINHVAAYKTQPTGRQLLVEVPSDYYTLYETDYDGYTVTEIGLTKKLSLYDSNWGDELYISLESDIGPNPVDIIQWLIEKYTDLAIDATSFSAVQARLTNYPTNFWVKERMNVLQLVQDIAFQSRCAVYIRNDVIYIVYLSEEPTSVRTITESDILSGTFQTRLTPTEDVITKHTIKWKNGEAGIESDDEVDRTIILKYNVPKYGVFEEEYSYYTQNTYDTILKSSTFWLIRRSHTWKLVEFETPVCHLDLDIFDCITLNVAQFSSSPIKCVLTKVEFNSQENKIHFEAWTPVLAGTDEAFFWAWPANQPEAYRWPLPDDEQWADPGYDFEVTPPAEHILSGGDTTQDENFVVLTSGDRFPSDSDDIFPTLFCEISDFEDVYEDEPAFKALEIAKRTARQVINTSMDANEAAEEGGGSGSDSDKKKERTACGEPQYRDGCIYEVNVMYISPTSVQSGKIGGGCIGGPCWCSAGGAGVCTGHPTLFCHTFGAAFAAWSFYLSKKAEIENKSASCGWYCGEWSAYSVGKPVAIADPDSPGSGCDEMPGDPSAPNQNEIYEPREA